MLCEIVIVVFYHTATKQTTYNNRETQSLHVSMPSMPPGGKASSNQWNLNQ